MDEEDLADLDESRRLRTEGSFAGLGSAPDGPSHATTVMDLFRPSDADTVGARLLQKMGWKPGQGVGRRIKRKARLGDDDEDGGEGETHLFAPKDTKMIAFVTKDDYKGLGFKGEAGLDRPIAVRDEEEDDATLLAASKSRMLGAKDKSKKASFGVGVLNDTGSDEEDPYELGPKLTFNRSIGIGKKIKKATESPRAAKPSANPGIGPRPAFRSAKFLSQQSAAHLRKCHDGKLPLTGFILSFNSPTTTLTKTYPPPSIPETWTPSKETPSSNPPEPKPWQSTASAAKDSTLTPAQRGALLAEPQLPSKSVFSYLTPAARAKIAAATGKPNLPPAGNEAPPPLGPYEPHPQTETEPQPSPWSAIPTLDPQTAKAALSRARARTGAASAPYASDPPKAARYVAFLEFGAGLRMSPPERDREMRHGEWEREMGEFARVARLSRPLGGLMATRFSAAKGVGGIGGEEEKGGDGVGRGELEDEGVKAAGLGMYGPLTRTIERFFPTRLLCKRFNVKAPAHVLADPGSAVGGEEASSKVEELVGRREMEKMMMFGTTQGAWSSAEGDGGLQLKMRELAVVDPEKNDAIEKEKPPMEVFKAIFGEDEDEDEE